MKRVSLLFLLFACHAGFAQIVRGVSGSVADTVICQISLEEDPLIVLDDFLEDSLGTIYRFTEEMPEFPGGIKAMTSFIKQSLHYPDTSFRYGIEGSVLVEFVVEKDGSLSHVNVKVPLFYDCDEEAVRIIKSMPKWNPAKIQGEPVRCYYEVPVVFRIER